MIKELKVIVLSENSSKNSQLKAEHGLSLYIEADNKKYIFDTGASSAFKDNAEKLSLDINNIDAVILSHSHYDHTGGLNFLKNQAVYVHSSFFLKKFKKVDGQYHDIGITYSENYYINNNALTFIKIDSSQPLTKGIDLVCNFYKQPHNDYFFVQTEDIIKPDFFEDELVLSFQTPKGLVIITGCAHSGIINIINKALELSNSKKIYALLGGFHLSKLSEEENIKIAHALNHFQISHLGISHCTGDKLKKYLSKEKTFDFNTGDTFKL